jgi:hypothetical protein
MTQTSPNGQGYIPRYDIVKTHYCDANDGCYALLDHDHPTPYYVTRADVGTGVHEIVWLYRQLRKFGRGRIAAAWEAWEIRNPARPVA